MTNDRLKALRSRARKHGFTMRKYVCEYRLIPRRGDALNSPALLPVPGRQVLSYTGDLDLIEAHLDWLDGDSARVDAYVSREKAESQARWEAQEAAEEANRRYWESIPRPVMDDQDRALLAARVRLREAVQGPRAGDYVILTGDAGPVRLTTNGGLNGIVTTWPQWTYSDRFYLDRKGRADHSGGNRFLDSIGRAQLVDTGETKAGSFWFFHHDTLAQRGGIDVELPCRVYRVEP
jgi:hypothetical protein